MTQYRIQDDLASCGQTLVRAGTLSLAEVINALREYGVWPRETRVEGPDTIPNQVDGSGDQVESSRDILDPYLAIGITKESNQESWDQAKILHDSESRRRKFPVAGPSTRVDPGDPRGDPTRFQRTVTLHDFPIGCMQI